jgi:hypothetical protein
MFSAAGVRRETLNCVADLCKSGSMSPACIKSKQLSLRCIYRNRVLIADCCHAIKSIFVVVTNVVLMNSSSLTNCVIKAVRGMQSRGCF